MSNAMIFYIGVLAFALMATGLLLTIHEFRHGEPHETADQDDATEFEKKRRGRPG